MIAVYVACSPYTSDMFPSVHFTRSGTTNRNKFGVQDKKDNTIKMTPDNPPQFTLLTSPQTLHGLFRPLISEFPRTLDFSPLHKSSSFRIRITTCVLPYFILCVCVCVLMTSSAIATIQVNELSFQNSSHHEHQRLDNWMLNIAMERLSIVSVAYKYYIHPVHA